MNTPTDADIESIERENRARHFTRTAQNFERKAQDPDPRITETEREHYRAEATRCRALANTPKP